MARARLGALALLLVTLSAEVTHAQCVEAESDRRLAFLRAGIARAKRRSTIWTATWASIYAAFAAFELSLTPARSEETRIDGYLSSIPPLVGLAGIAVTPPRVFSASRALNRTLADASAGPCQKVERAESILWSLERADEKTQAAWLHVANFAVNFGAGVAMGAGFSHWADGGILILAGTLVGEIFLLTRPRDGIGLAARYRSGDWRR